MFRPTVYIDSGYDHKPDVRKTYPTYAELKKDLKNLIAQSPVHKVHVYRYRRGEWGEWFEHWGFNYKRKPVITKEGWM